MNRSSGIALFPYAIGAGLLLTQCFAMAEQAQGPDEEAMWQRAVVSRGDLARIRRVVEKSRRGERVTIGVIGGSITQGASATTEGGRYGNRIADWWRGAFPGAEVGFVNAGIGATGSNYGALRAGRDLLSREPDLVVVEFGVNDPNAESAAETVEGLVRQILKQPNDPAVVLLFMMAKGATEPGNAQEWLGKVGAHYGLPMLSFRDALWPEIAAGRLAWEDVMADVVHPNDRGHGYAAGFVTRLVEEVRSGPAPTEAELALAPIPEPMISDLFEHVSLLEARDLQPTRSEGWAYDPATDSWRADQPGSVVEFEIEGEVILEMEHHVRGPMGMASFQVDDREPLTRDAWFDQTWGGWRCTVEAARGLAPGKHRVRVTLLAERNAESTGNEFRLLGLGAAGVPH